VAILASISPTETVMATVTLIDYWSFYFTRFLACSRRIFFSFLFFFLFFPFLSFFLSVCLSVFLLLPSFLSVFQYTPQGINEFEALSMFFQIHYLNRPMGPRQEKQSLEVCQPKIKTEAEGTPIQSPPHMWPIHIQPPN